MKVLTICDSFKGSLTSLEVNNCVEKGIKQVYPDALIYKIPIADGGEGTVDALINTLGGKHYKVEVSDPLRRKIEAVYGILPNNTAIMEMASCCGLTLLKPKEQNPLETTTYGLGEMIIDAINKGCRKFIIGIGGSATNDCGIGMLEALGYKFLDKNQKPLPTIGKSLNYINFIDDKNKLAVLDECEFTILCDVTNPLYGENGAAYVYAKQKGASDTDIEYLDKGLKNFATIIKKYYNIDISTIQGVGAAGGLGAGFYAFLNGKLLSGIDVIFNLVGIEKIITDVDLIITGEGKIDKQSIMGKVLTGVGSLGKKYQVPVIAICGTLSDEIEHLHNHGISALFSIMNYPMSLEEAISNTAKLIELNIKEIFRLIKKLVIHN